MKFYRGSRLLCYKRIIIFIIIIMCLIILDEMWTQDVEKYYYISY